MSDVIHFAEMGDHRTASSVDLTTSDWIRSELAKAGFTAELDPWPLRQFQDIDCALRVFGMDYDTFPLWHPRASGSHPILAPLVHAEDIENLSGAIALVQFPDVMVTPKSAHAGIIEALHAAGARGIIGCTPHKSGAIYGQNVIPPFNQTPWPLPVLMIAPSDWHVFAAAAQHGALVEFKLNGTDRQDAMANNVVAYQERGERWMIVSTPQSGWFRSAGERGAGVALLLGLARWMAALDTGHSLLFLSNSGHEIGHMGAFHALNSAHLPKPRSNRLLAASGLKHRHARVRHGKPPACSRCAARSKLAVCLPRPDRPAQSRIPRPATLKARDLQPKPRRDPLDP